MVESTGLFSAYGIADNQKHIIAKFGNPNEKIIFIPIKDSANVTWGYFYFKTNFYHFFSSFFASAIFFLALVLTAYFFTRWRMRSSLEKEFSRFNRFLSEIEMVTEKLHEIYHDENFTIHFDAAHNREQIIINRAISRLLDEIKKANKSLHDAVSLAEQQRFKEELTRTALQVTHDIGSPLAMLEAIIQSNSVALPEISRTPLLNAANRIRDISNSLLLKAKPDLLDTEKTLTQQPIYHLINQVISEKRLIQNSKITIDKIFDELAYTFFAFIRPSDFCRVISNLINNAIEAVDQQGRITISLSSQENKIAIEIQDTGKGIDEKIIGQLGQLGKSYGKDKGLGIGLYHAFHTIENWGGEIKISSTLNVGTLIKITIPQAQSPTWFIPMIEIRAKQNIVIIDDDQFIHSIWQERFKPYENQINLIHLNRAPMTNKAFNGLREMASFLHYLLLCPHLFYSGILRLHFYCLANLLAQYRSYNLICAQLHGDCLPIL